LQDQHLNVERKDNPSPARFYQNDISELLLFIWIIAIQNYYFTIRRRFLNPILVTVDVLPFRRIWCHSFLSLHFTRSADRTRNNIHRKKRKRITHTGATCTDSRRSFLVCRWSLFVQHSHVEFSSKFLLEFFTRERATKTLFRHFTCS